MSANTVKVKGPLLASDMFEAKLSRDRLLSKISEKGEFEVPSTSTLRRAEAGGPIEIEMLKAIAHGLGYPINRYIDTGEDLPSETLCKIGGSWEGYYIELDMDCKKLGLVSSEMSIVQHGANLHIHAIETEEGTQIERGEEVLEALIVRDMVMTKSRVTGWAPPFGVGYTLLKVSRGDEVMRGHSIWYDLDTEEIETSKCIYVRSDSQYREHYLERVKEELEAEIKLRSSKV